MPGLDDFIGQTDLKNLIRSKIEFAKANGVTLPHLLISGEEGQGKMAFATAIAAEMGTRSSTVSAYDLNKTPDLTGIVTNIRPGEIIALERVEGMRSPVTEVLVEAISRFEMTILIGTGPGARTHRISILRFTLIGTTSKPWSVDERIRRWCTACTFAPYSGDELQQIVLRIAAGKRIELTPDAALDIASHFQRPGEVEVFLQRIASHLPAQGTNRIDRATLQQLSDFLGSGNLYPDALRLADQVRTMDGIEFEHWVADLFRRAGFQVEVTQASGDHGVDLWASTQGRRVAVQCKRWDGAVGEPVLRDLYGAMMATAANSACLVTTGTFTPQAHQFAKGKPIHLVGLDLLMDAANSPERLQIVLARA